MRKVIDSLSSALAWVHKLPVSRPGAAPDIEGAPRRSEDKGPVPDAHWRPLAADLSDLPRGERWLIKAKGGSSKEAVAVFLAVGDDSPGGALDKRGPGPDEILRQRYALMAEREQLLREKVEFINSMQAMLTRSREIDREASESLSTNVTSFKDIQATALASLQTDKALMIDLAAARDEVSDLKSRNEMVRQGAFCVNRIADAVVMYQARKSGKVPPELDKRFAQFLAWERREVWKESQAEPGEDEETAAGRIDAEFREYMAFKAAQRRAQEEGAPDEPPDGSDAPG